MENEEKAKAISPANHIPPTFRTTHPYQGDNSAYLSFGVDQKITILPPIEDPRGWLYGHLDDTGEEGWFPPAYIKRIDTVENTICQGENLSPVGKQKGIKNQNLREDLKIRRVASDPILDISLDILKIAPDTDDETVSPYNKHENTMRAIQSALIPCAHKKKTNKMPKYVDFQPLPLVSDLRMDELVVNGMNRDSNDTSWNSHVTLLPHSSNTKESLELLFPRKNSSQMEFNPMATPFFPLNSQTENITIYNWHQFLEIDQILHGQSDISETFSKGDKTRSVWDTITDLENNLPFTKLYKRNPFRVVFYRGQYWATNGNRRLFCLKKYKQIRNYALNISVKVSVQNFDKENPYHSQLELLTHGGKILKPRTTKKRPEKYEHL